MSQFCTVSEKLQVTGRKLDFFLSHKHFAPLLGWFCWISNAGIRKLHLLD